MRLFLTLMRKWQNMIELYSRKIGIPKDIHPLHRAMKEKIR